MRSMILFLTLLCLPVLAQNLDVRDDFSTYKNGDEPGGPWLATANYEVRDGHLAIESYGTDDLGLKDDRWFRQVKIEATVIVHKRLGNLWSVVGLGITHDDERRWQAALVEGPVADGSKHYFEVAMGLPGKWPTGDGVTITDDLGSGFDWQYDHPYRITLELGGNQIHGTLAELDGKVVGDRMGTLAAPAVMDGAPIVHCSNFTADFDDVRIAASDPSGAPQAVTAKTLPPVQVATLPQIKGRKTGFFHVEQQKGTWWVIAPSGDGFYAIGTDHVRYTGHWCEALGYAPYGRNTERIYGTEDKWAAVATDRLKSWNFNLLGAGWSGGTPYRGLAHVEFLSMGSGFAVSDPLVKQVNWTGFPNVFSPRWAKWCDQIARRACKSNRDDPWVYGYFIDNELEWWGKDGGEVGLAWEAAKLPADNSAKQALLQLFRDKYQTIDHLNAAWGAKYASWDALAAATKLAGSNAEALRKDELAFVALAADKYFSAACDAIRKYDPNHMVIGCRFAGSAPPGCFEAAGRYCDIISFNYYGNVDLLAATADQSLADWNDYYRRAKRPMMITEWSFPALDAGLPCKGGAGMRVDTQAQKALCFEVYQRQMFGLPFMVGSDYFMYIDEPALAISKTFPEDSNYGLVNEQDVPYQTLTETATRVNAMAYQLHSGDAPQLEVRKVGLQDGKIQAQVANTGRQPAHFDLAFGVGGQTETSTVALAAGETRWFPMTHSPAPPAYVSVVADPDRKLPQRNWQVCRGGFLYYKQGASPASPAGKWIARWPLLVTTGPVGLPEGSVLTISGEELQGHGAAEVVGRRLAAYDEAGKLIPCQLEPWADGWQVAVATPAVAPYAGRLIFLALTDTDLPTAAPAVALTLDGSKWRADNGVLVLEGTGGGNAVDAIAYKGTSMGNLNPLVWEKHHGQDLWTTTAVTTHVSAFNGPVRAAVEVTCESNPPAPAITAVDNARDMAAQGQRPHKFSVAHRIYLAGGKSWFADQFVSLRNLDADDLELRGWFSYLRSAIGGTSADDVSGGPAVPDYWQQFGAWENNKLGLTLGAKPANDPRMSCTFWKDPGGGEHADLRRILEQSVMIRPKAEYREEGGAPLCLIFAGPTDAKPWSAVTDYANGLGYAKIEMLAGERP
jgi:hypothetical protein